MLDHTTKLKAYLTMSEFNPKKANVSKEFKEFFNSDWSQNKFAVISFFIIFIGFFIPVLNYLVVIFASIAIPLLIYKTERIQKVFKFKQFRTPLIIGILFASVLIGSTVAATAYNLAVIPSPTTKEIIKEDTAKLEAEQQKRIEAENLAKEEQTKREEAEKSRQELEGKIAEAQVINTNYDVESDLGSQDPQTAVQANLAIAGLGRETKNQKLFDVISVVDGDTIKVSELGTLRLIGMDTPETKDPRKPVQCFGKEASARATELLSGKKAYLEFDPTNRIDKYGRTLAYVYREDGYFFNAEMIKEGYANSYTKYPHPKLEEFNGYQKSAREGSKGLWASTTCNGDSTQSVVVPETPVASSTPAKTTTPTAPKPASSAPASTSGFIAGTCTELKAKGLGNFPKGDPNYTSGRDRDKDGIACNLP